MNKLIAVIAIVATLAGCATIRETFNLDEEEQGIPIDCSGTGLTWGTCFAKADSLCGTGGYEVLGKTGDPATGPGGQTGLFGSAALNRNMVIRCKNGPAPPNPSELNE